MRLLVLSILLWNVACSPKRQAALSPATTYTFEPEDERGFDELRKSLESTVLENYTQLTYNNVEAFLDSIVLDREVHLVGVTPKDLVIGIKPDALSKDRRLYSQRSPRVLSKNLDVHLSKDGSVAWVFDEISYRVQYMNREASIPIRLTAVFVRDVERWLMVSEHQSFGISTGELVDLVSNGRLVSGRKIEDGYGGPVKRSAKLLSVVGRFINTGEGMTSTEEALVLFHGPTQEFHGSNATEALSLAQSFGESTTVALREFRVQVATSERVAWIVANLIVSTNLNGLPLSIPLRGTFILERTQNETWVITQAHISAPLLERQISNWVFGPN